jgi:hypothetical protein
VACAEANIAAVADLVVVASGGGRGGQHTRPETHDDRRLTGWRQSKAHLRNRYETRLLVACPRRRPTVSDL